MGRAAEVAMVGGMAVMVAVMVAQMEAALKVEVDWGAAARAVVVQVEAG